MRILTGKFRGRVLPFHPQPKLLRPTADKIRKAIFDSLQGQWEGSQVLDLYCGTGALGLEAFSNGAARVTFVDNNPSVLENLKNILETLGVRAQSTVLCLEALKAIKKFSAGQKKFDAVFLDPPYGTLEGMEALEHLSGGEILEEQAWVIWETSSRQTQVPEAWGRLKKIQSKEYGDTQVHFYRAML